VLGHRWLWSSILTFTIFGALTIPAAWVLGPATSWRGLGGVTGWSALTSAFGAGALVGSFVALQLNTRRPGVVLMAALIVAALRPATFVSGWSLPVIAAYSFLAGAAMAAAGVIWYTLLQTMLPSSVLSRVSAIDDFGTYLLTPIGHPSPLPWGSPQRWCCWPWSLLGRVSRRWPSGSCVTSTARRPSSYPPLRRLFRCRSPCLLWAEPRTEHDGPMKVRPVGSAT
jgi:MFS family permease